MKFVVVTAPRCHRLGARFVSTGVLKPGFCQRLLDSTPVAVQFLTIVGSDRTGTECCRRDVGRGVSQVSPPQSGGDHASGLSGAN